MGRERETRPGEGHKWVTTAEEIGTWKEVTIRSEQTTKWLGHQLHKGQGEVNLYDRQELYRNMSHLLSSKDALEVEIFTLNGDCHRL